MEIAVSGLERKQHVRLEDDLPSQLEACTDCGRARLRPHRLEGRRMATLVQSYSPTTLRPTVTLIFVIVEWSDWSGDTPDTVKIPAADLTTPPHSLRRAQK